MLLAQPFELSLQLDMFVFDHSQPPQSPTPKSPNMCATRATSGLFAAYTPRKIQPPEFCSIKYHNQSQDAA
jgi:hypothetical protein